MKHTETRESDEDAADFTCVGLHGDDSQCDLARRGEKSCNQSLRLVGLNVKQLVLPAPQTKQDPRSARTALRFFYEAGLQADGTSVDLAGDLVVAIHQTDAFCLGAPFENPGAALELQILDQGHRIPVGEHRAESVLNDPRSGLFGFTLPFVAARDAFKAITVFQNIGHFAHRAGRLAHKSPQISFTPRRESTALFAPGIFRNRHHFRMMKATAFSHSGAHGLLKALGRFRAIFRRV